MDTEPTQELAGLHPDEVRQVEQFVQTRLADSIRIDELAGVLNRSPSCFIRLFKRATGETPHQYIVKARVRRATELIRDDNHLSLSQIALRCGFADQAHLTRVFRKITGQTPASFCRFQRESVRDSY